MQGDFPLFRIIDISHGGVVRKVLPLYHSLKNNFGGVVLKSTTQL